MRHSKHPESRSVLKFYTPQLLGKFPEMSAIGTLLFYSLFVMISHPNMVITVPLVLLGFFRYWYISEASDISESPTDALYSDWRLETHNDCYLAGLFQYKIFDLNIGKMVLFNFSK